MTDPAAAEGTPAEQLAAFERAYDLLTRRMKALVALPIDALDGPQVRDELLAIAHAERQE